MRIYYPFKEAQTANFELQNLQDWLLVFGFKDFNYLDDDRGMIYESLQIVKMLKSNKVVLWSHDNIKPMAHIQFEIDKELEKIKAFHQGYIEYSDKRWEDMPKLEMSTQNYEEIVCKWQKIMKQKPQFLIFSQDDSGRVELIGKDELLLQDLADMKIEHGKYLKYRAAWEKYNAAKPNRSEVWRSPVDDEYEADWQKYYDK